MDSSLCSLRATSHLPDPVSAGAQHYLQASPRCPCWAGRPGQKRDLPPCEGHLPPFFCFCSWLPHPCLQFLLPRSSSSEALLRRTLGPRFGIEPKFTLVFPRNVGFAIKSWSSCDTRGLVGRHGRGTFEVVLSARTDPFFPITRSEDKR